MRRIGRWHSRSWGRLKSGDWRTVARLMSRGTRRLIWVCLGRRLISSRPHEHGNYADSVVHPRGLEPLAFGSASRRSVQLSYGCNSLPAGGYVRVTGLAGGRSKEKASERTVAFFVYQTTHTRAMERSMIERR